MGLREDLQSQIADLEAKLAILDGTPEDTFTFGTIAIFSAATGAKWYYLKTNEETWVRLNGQGTNNSNPLDTWIYQARASNIGYFEVYIMNTAQTPIYASA